MSPGFLAWATGEMVVPIPEMEKWRRKRKGSGRKMLTYLVMSMILVDRLSGDPWQAGGWIVDEEIGCTWGEGSVWNSVVLVDSEGHGGWEPHPAEWERGRRQRMSTRLPPDTVPEMEDHLGRGACDGNQEAESQEMEKKNQDKAISWEPRKKKNFRKARK